MNLLRKAAAVGASVALLGSLVASVAAPLALASTSVTSAGSIPVGHTSRDTATFFFAENSSGAFTGPGSLTVTVLDDAGGNTLTLSGGAVSGPGSLSPSLSVSGNTFTVTTLSSDFANIETITVTGIAISASSTAALGAVQATLSGSLASGVTLPGQFNLASPGMVTDESGQGQANRGMRWDPAVEWRTYPRQMNPSPDHYGNPGVWSYMGSTSQAHDPLSYYLLPVYQATSANSWVQVWQDPDYGYLLVSRARPTPFFPGGGPSIGMHPYGGPRMAILAWTSPVAGEVTITGSAKLVDAECFDVGSGVVWSVDRGAESLYVSVLPSGGESSFSFVASAVAGQTFYFILDPGADDSCDTTHVNLVISKK